MMKRKLILPVVALSLTGLPSHSLHAIGLSLQDSIKTHRLEEVQVTATRASAKTPMSYTNVGKAQLQKSNLGMDIPYLLLQTPSVVATSEPGFGIGYTYIRVRGVDAAGINVMTNGVPLNDSESQGVFWANMPNFSSSVQDAQLQRGVGTSSNGSAAFGASLNLRTDNFSLTPRASISVLGGSFHTLRREVSASTGRIAGHWALEARVGRTATDGYVDRSGTKGDSYFLQAGYFGERSVFKLLAFGGKQRTGIAWNGLSPEDEAKYGRTYNSAGHVNPSAPASEARYRENTDNYEQRHYQAQLTQQLSDRLTLSLTAHYTKGYGYYDEYRSQEKLSKMGLASFSQTQPDGSTKKIKKIDLLQAKYLDNDFGGLIAGLEYKTPRLELTAGLSGNHFVNDHYGYRSPITATPYSLDPSQRYYDNRAHKTDLSGFVKASYELLSGLSLFADLQYRFIDYRISGTNDRVEQGKPQELSLKKRFNFFNPKAGLFYQFAPQHHLYASVAVAHREPNRDNYTKVTPKDYPSAERLTDWELGYGYRSERFTAGINVYYMRYKDQLVKNGKKSDVGGDLSENVAKSYRAGLELSSSLLLLPSLRWDLALGMSRNRIADYTLYVEDYDSGKFVAKQYQDTEIAYSPSATVSNTLTLTLGRFEAALSSQFVGRQYLDNTTSQTRSIPSYHVEHLRLGYELPVNFVKGWSLNLQLSNLLDRRYVSGGWGGFGLSGGQESSWLALYPQAGRHLLLGTTITL